MRKTNREREREHFRFGIQLDFGSFTIIILTGLLDIQIYNLVTLLKYRQKYWPPNQITVDDPFCSETSEFVCNICCVGKQVVMVLPSRFAYVLWSNCAKVAVLWDSVSTTTHWFFVHCLKTVLWKNNLMDDSHAWHFLPNSFHFAVKSHNHQIFASI